MKVVIRDNTGQTRRYTLADGSVLELKSRGCAIIEKDLLTENLLNAKSLRRVTITNVKEVEQPVVQATTISEESNTVTTKSKKVTSSATTEKAGDK